MQCPPTKPGEKRRKVPLCARGLQDFGRVDAKLPENDRELVHQRNVEVALGVLDHLCGLGYRNAAGPMRSGLDD